MLNTFQVSISLDSCAPGINLFSGTQFCEFCGPQLSLQYPFFFFSGLLIHSFFNVLTTLYIFNVLITFSSLFHPTARLQSPHPSAAFLEAGSLTLYILDNVSSSEGPSLTLHLWAFSISTPSLHQLWTPFESVWLEDNPRIPYYLNQQLLPTRF